MPDGPTTAPSTSSGRRPLVILRGFCIILIALLATELLFRYNEHPNTDTGFMRADPDLIWIPQRGDPRDLSFDDDDSDAVRLPRRVISVGDSSVYGFGVQDSEDFTAQLEELSRGQLRTLNCAGPGYSTYQSLRIVEAVVPREQPHLVIIANLWSDNNFDAFVDKEMLEERNRLLFRFAFYANRLLQSSAIWRYLLESTGATTAVRAGWGRQNPSGYKVGPRRVAINDYARNLWSMVDLVEADGGEVLFIALTNDVMVEGFDAESPWTSYRRTMFDIAARRGYPAVDVTVPYRASGLSVEELFVDQMHPSKLGHRLIAEAILDLLTDRGWFEGRPIKDGSAPTEPLPTYEDRFVSQRSQ